MYGRLQTREIAALVAILAFGCLLPYAAPEYFVYLGNSLMMYAILALGLDLLLGWSGQFAFAHIAFFGVGIYGTAILQQRYGLPFLVSMPISAAAAGMLGWLIAWPSTRLRSVYLALATYAFAECAQWVFRTWDSVTKGSDGLRISPTAIFGYVINSDQRAFPVVAILLCLVVLSLQYLTKSKLGRHLCAIRDSEHVAAASGIDVRQVKITAFTLSAVYAGIAGGVYVLFQSFVNPDVLGASQLVLVLTMVVVGGSGSLIGVTLGVVVVGLLPEVLRLAPSTLLVWQEFVYGLILVLVVMFMPRGLWGVMNKWFAPKPAMALNASTKTDGDTVDAQEVGR
ncbi:MAG TPA: branched-chain amino acid ABC transporter permease [Pseudolabrys sp.]|nr:branched-chain amino acid ABC transporter permease [Pseudolabrys sp.]